MAKYKLLPGFDSNHTGEIFDIEKPVPKYHNWSPQWDWAFILNKWPHGFELVPEEKLPENWCILRTKENASVINEWNNNLKRIGESFRDEAWSINSGDYFYPDKSHNNKYDSSYTEITFDQFKRLVLKEEPMKEKEIIGYKLKDGCEDYYQASCAICNGLAVSRSDVMKLDLYPTVILKLSRAGVLDLWFEPVYKQTYPDITINGYKGEFFEGYVKFGCAKISKQMFVDLHSKCLVGFDSGKYVDGNKEIESVTIGKGTFTKHQIKEIAEYYLNKK